MSKLFFDIVGLSHFNLGLVLPSEMEQLVRVFGRYQKPLGLAFNKPHKLSVQDMAHLSSLTQLTCLSAKEAYIDGPTLIHLTNLVSLEAENITPATLQHLSKLTRLHVRRATNEIEITLPNLVSLELISKPEKALTWGQEDPAINIKLDDPTPIRSLSIDYQGGYNALFTDNPEYERCTEYQFSANMFRNLTSLSLRKVLLKNEEDIPWHQLNSLSLYIPGPRMDISTLRHISKCTNLTSLNVLSVKSQHLIDAINVHELQKLQSFTLLMGGAAPFGSVKNLLPQLNTDTLKALHMIIFQDHKECIAEISRMTKLESLKLYVKHLHNEAYELDDVAPFMTMTQLTSLYLSVNKCKGLDNMTNLTNLQSLTISCDYHQPLESLNVSSLSNLTSLELMQVASLVNLRGITKLRNFAFDSQKKSESAIEMDPAELGNLEHISIGYLSEPIPWTDLARCTKLNGISTDSFVQTDDSILALQNLRQLTRLGHFDLYYSKSPCTHFDMNHLTTLTRLQHLEIRVHRSKCNYSIPFLIC